MKSRPPPPRRARPDAPKHTSSPRVRIDLYGHHAVNAAVLNPNRVIKALYAAEGAGDELLELVTRAKRAGIARPALTLLPRPAFDAALGDGAVHQGVGAACDPLPEVDVNDLIRAGEAGGRQVIVMLDQVTDPHNLGAIMRSAAVFGAAGLVVQRRHTPELNGTIAKIACGAVDLLTVAYETNLARSLEVLKDSGFTCVGLDERGDHTLPEFVVPDKTVLVLGAEGPGLRRLVRDGCDQLVRLPTGARMSSLNVSNAAAVALYHFLQV